MNWDLYDFDTNTTIVIRAINWDSPIFYRCTIFQISNDSDDNGLGLGVIQQYYTYSNKTTMWSAIDGKSLHDITAKVNTTEGAFPKLIKLIKRLGKQYDESDGSYPVVTLRHFKHLLGLRPDPVEKWETYFTRELI